MPISADIPTLGKPKTVKDAVIFVLTNEWPLSSKQIYNSVNKMGFNVSYQAVHKTVRNLSESGILTKNERKYELNTKWVRGLEEFGSVVGKSYKNGKKMNLKELVGKDILNLQFETIKNFMEFSISVFVAQYPNPDNKTGIINFCHIYPMVGYSEKVYKEMKDFCPKYRFYCLCKNDTPLDRWFADFFKKMGKKVKLGVHFANDYDMCVVGDYVMQAFFTEGFRKKMDDLYRKTKSLEEVNLHELLSYIFEKRTEIKAVIFKNPKIADQIREDTIEHFGKEGKHTA